MQRDDQVTEWASDCHTDVISAPPFGYRASPNRANPKALYKMFRLPPNTTHSSSVRPFRVGVRLAAATLAGAAVLAVAPVGSATGTDVGAAEAALEEATKHREATEARLAALEAEAATLNDELGRLDSGAAKITQELAQARQEVREYAIAAYIDGGRAALLAAAVQVSEGNDMAWSAQIMGSQTAEAGNAVDRFEALKAANEPDRVAAAASLDELNSRLADVSNDLIQASAHERDAETALALARDYEARQAASAAAAEKSSSAQTQRAVRQDDDQDSGTTPKRQASAPSAPAPSAPAPSAPASAPSATGSPSSAEQQMLAKIRHCESRGNYSIVSSSGKYRGAYQFDTRTWQGVGGSGDPAAASPAEQDYRALLLYRQRGRRPWPNCA